ncbi:MAG: ATP-binding cassette, subfamily bacterial [Frankiaceae bacterium]|jgi:ATP-binding cassette subfamily B protein|nr:ATP-binding cassette, subfamily bacterial [Frankiaceae bacterium]
MSMGGPAGWQVMHSFRRDSSVTDKRLPKGTIKRIARFAAPYKRQLVWFLVLVVIDAVIGAANPLIYKAIIENGILGHSRDLVVGLAVLIAVLAVIDGVINLGNRVFSARIGEGLIYDMRSSVFSHIQRMPLAFFTRTRTGALISRINNDVLGAQQAFTGTLSNVVSNVISVTLVLIAMMFLSWQITLLALAMIPLFIIPARLMSKRLQELTREAYALNAEMSTQMTERFNVSGALLVKLFGRLPDEDQMFRGKARRVADIGVQQAIYARILFVCFTLVAALGTALVYGMGGYQAVNDPKMIGTVVAMAAFLNRLYGPITALSNVQVDVMTALVSFDRVFEVLDLPPMIEDKPDAIALPAKLGSGATIEFDNVDFRYPTAAEVSLASLESVATLDNAPEKQVLHGVSFRAEPGQLVALVGPSGAGKTTISQLVTRMYDVQGGAVRVGGHDVRDVALQSLLGAVGVVTQDAHMFHESIRANLLYARPDATEEQLWAAVDAAQIGELIRELPDGLDTVVGDRGYRMSGGEKQRLAIARLLLKAPSIVVLDEATAHLDSESEAAVQRALRTALAGRTSLVIAHRLSTVREAHQILVVDDGRIVERGTHDELVAVSGLYAELYRTQFEGQPEPDLDGLAGETLRA